MYLLYYMKRKITITFMCTTNHKIATGRGRKQAPTDSYNPDQTTTRRQVIARHHFRREAQIAPSHTRERRSDDESSIEESRRVEEALEELNNALGHWSRQFLIDIIQW
jgi:hypothetical protein